MTLSGNMKRKMKSASRLYAVQALFQMEHSGQTVEAVSREFEDFRFGADYDEGEMIEGDVDHFRFLMETAVSYQARIDQMTDRALVAKWPIARIDPTLRALFRAAGAEMVQSDTPPKVAQRMEPIVSPHHHIMLERVFRFQGACIGGAVEYGVELRRRTQSVRVAGFREMSQRTARRQIARHRIAIVERREIRIRSRAVLLTTRDVVQEAGSRHRRIVLLVVLFVEIDMRGVAPSMRLAQVLLQRCARFRRRELVPVPGLIDERMGTVPFGSAIDEIVGQRRLYLRLAALREIVFRVEQEVGRRHPVARVA